MKPLFLICSHLLAISLHGWESEHVSGIFSLRALILLMLLNIGGSYGKEFACSAEDPGWEDPLEKRRANHSSTSAWRILWTEEPDGYSPWGHKELDRTEQLTLLLIPLIRAPLSGPNYLPNAPPPNTLTRGSGLPLLWMGGCIQSILHHYCIKNQLKASESAFPDYDSKLEAIHVNNCRH